MSVSSISTGGSNEAAAPDVLQLSPFLTTKDRKQQQIQREQKERIIRGGTNWDLYRGRLRSAAVSIFLLASVIAVLFMVSQCFFLSRQQQKQLLQLQSVRRLAAEKETGEEKENGGDNNFSEHMCEEEGKKSQDTYVYATTNRTTYPESGRRLELSTSEEGQEMEEIKDYDGDDDDDEPPKKKKKDEEMELQKEEGIFPLTPSFDIEMYAPASPTAEAATGGAARGAAAAESMRESILQYVEEILADDNGDSEAVEDDIYFVSLLSELNMMAGTQSMDEVQHQQHKLQQQHKVQQQQQPERKQQVLVDQFSNAVQSAVVVPAYDGKNNPDYDNGQGKEPGEEKEGDDGNGGSGGEFGKNDVTDDSDNDDNDGNGHTDHSDDTNDNNSDGSHAGDEGAADDDDNEDDGDNDGGNNNDNDDDADDEYASTVDDNGYADAEDNDDAAVFAAAAADDDGTGDGTEDVNDEDDNVSDTADEGTSAAAFAAAAAAAPADYGTSIWDELAEQRQQQRGEGSSSSRSSKGQTLHVSSEEGSSHSPYQVAVIVNPPGRLPVEVEAEIKKRRRNKGRKEQHFQKQFIFAAGKPNAKGAYMVVCKVIHYRVRATQIVNKARDREGLGRGCVAVEAASK